MKTFLLKPGFEFIFSISLIVILGLPPMLMAQSTKELEIKIENGDTTINGKNIKQLSAKDRQDALIDIKHLNGGNDVNTDRKYSLKRRDTVGGRTGRMEFRRKELENGGHGPVIAQSTIIRDSLGNVIAFKSGRARNMDPKRRFNEMGEHNPDRPFDSPMMHFERKNSQYFDYVNTDNAGISTHVNYHVAEASNDDLKKLERLEGSKFEINDLNIVPEFTTGKTLLMFNLPAKAPAEVKFSDSEGKILWIEKVTGGSFSKTFTLGLNGIYYLKIKQGNNITVKKIMKQD
jgi:hypothetical protein